MLTPAERRALDGLAARLATDEPGLAKALRMDRRLQPAVRGRVRRLVAPALMVLVASGALVYGTWPVKLIAAFVLALAVLR